MSCDEHLRHITEFLLKDFSNLYSEVVYVTVYLLHSTHGYPTNAVIGLFN